jgi:hypothetical protein
MPVEEVSNPNNEWGICGFCSSLGAMYTRDPRMAARIDRAISLNQYRTRLLAEVKTFLVMLRAAGKVDLMDQIIRFNGRWYPSGFDYLAYIARVNSIARGTFSPDAQYTLALTPDALVYYLREVCEFAGARWVPGDTGADGILGLCQGGRRPLLERLDHWVYRHNGIVYNWGAADPDLSKLLTARSWSVGVHVLF